MFINKIDEILAADIIDIKQRLKEKKVEDKEQKKQQKETEIKPQFDKSQLKVLTSSAFAGGYELQATVPVPAEFIRDKKKDNKGEFVRQLHGYIDERIGKWMGPPALAGLNERAKNGFLMVNAKWYFDDAFFAYALGLNLAEWRGSNEVVEKSQIAHRMNLAEKAYKELQGFRDVANKKLKLRSQDKEEQNKIWKEEFMENWIALDKKWRERGISYTALHGCERDKRAVGFAQKVHAKYQIKE